MSVNIFWDNSNILLVGRNFSTDQEPGHKKDFRIYFRNLLQFAANNRDVSYAFVAGSIPPQNDNLWQYFKKLGAVVETQERGILNNKEVAVDEIIHKKMLERIVDVKTPETIVLLMGDGNGYAQGKGFIRQLERAVDYHWEIEVISWNIGCNKRLKEFASHYGTYRELDPVYNSVTFTNDRIVRPLPHLYGSIPCQLHRGADK